MKLHDLRGQQTRFANTAPQPQSYDSSTRSVHAIISMGSPVQRSYGTEVLRIAPGAVILDRLATSGVPLLDSHIQRGIENHLGRITQVWFKDKALWGRITFDETERGRVAEGMVARGEIAGISAGYIVRDWEITDSEGTVLDPEKDRIRMDDDLTFTATRWELLEASLVSVPADSKATVRSLLSRGVDRLTASALARMEARMRRIGISPTAQGPLARMRARQRMIDRMR